MKRILYCVFILLQLFFTSKIFSQEILIVKKGKYKVPPDFSNLEFNSIADFYSKNFNWPIYFSNTDFNLIADFQYVDFNSEAYFHETNFNSVANFQFADFNSEVFFTNAKFKSSAIFSNSKFVSDANYKKAEFNLTAIFSNSKFSLDADFTSASFNSFVNFTLTEFNSEAKFKFIIFNSKVDFSYAKFNSNTIFNLVIFGSSADFTSTSFNSFADFTLTEFNSEAKFTGAKFDSVVVFNDAEFKSDALFTNAKFNSDAIFSRTKFDSVANFSNAEFNSGIDLYMLPKYLDLSNVRIKNEEIDLFSNIHVNSEQGYCLINLSGAEIQKIKLNMNEFKLYFPLNTSWEVKETTYEQLLNKTKKEGFNKGYEIIDKQYREAIYLEGYKKPKYLINFIDKKWWDYGYNKGLIIKNTLILFIIFTSINFFILRFLINEIYLIEKIKAGLNVISENLIVNLLIRIYYSLLYTGFIFFSIKFTANNFKYTENLSFIKVCILSYLIIVYLTGKVCLGWLANYLVTI